MGRLGQSLNPFPFPFPFFDRFLEFCILFLSLFDTFGGWFLTSGGRSSIQEQERVLCLAKEEFASAAASSIQEQERVGGSRFDLTLPQDRACVPFALTNPSSLLTLSLRHLVPQHCATTSSLTGTARQHASQDANRCRNSCVMSTSWMELHSLLTSICRKKRW